jgi:hypothetical protein
MENTGKKNKLISIGYMANFCVYLKTSKAEAIQRYIKEYNLTKKQM